MNDGLLLPLLRGLHLAAVFALFGSVVFTLVILPAARDWPDSQAAEERRLSLLARFSAALALLLGAGWFVAETANLAGVDNPGAVLGFLPLVTFQTQFGGWLVLRLALLLAILLLPAHPILRWPTLLLAGAAIGIQPMLGHAGAEPGIRGHMLVGAEAVHLLAAAAWLGGLPPLWLTVRHLPQEVAARVCASFSWLGMVMVSLIAGTGLLLYLGLVGGIAELLRSAYGHFVLLKTGLFALALVLAALNRFAFAPSLATGDRGRLLLSIATEAGIGGAIILAAAFLAAHMPGMDMAQPGAGEQAAIPLGGLWRAALLGLGLGGAGVLAATLWRRTVLRWTAALWRLIAQSIALERGGNHGHNH